MDSEEREKKLEEEIERKAATVGFEEVVESDFSDDSDARAEVLAMGTLMLRKKQKQALIDASYNRFAQLESSEEQPQWFKDDQQMHNRPLLPVTKEMVDRFKEKLKAINARPLKKMVEAKARKKMRALKRLEKTKSKADAIASSDGPDSNKLQQIQKLYKKADKRKIKAPPTFIVAKKGGGSVTVKAKGGGKKGARGAIRRVDSRMKNDLRAQKRAAAKKSSTKGKSSTGKGKGGKRKR